MNTEFWIEMFGYCGSFIVLISFLMTSVFKLRIVNTIGSIIFMIYALIIKSYPTAIMNLCLVLINVRFLWKMMKMGQEYELIVTDKNDRFLKYLLDRYSEDINKCFPGINYDLNEVNSCYIVTCQGNPVAVTLGIQNGDELELVLDYSTTAYRDFSIGTFLMNNLTMLNISKVIYKGPVEYHTAYLNKMGFVKDGDSYIKHL